MYLHMCICVSIQPYSPVAKSIDLGIRKPGFGSQELYLLCVFSINLTSLNLSFFIRTNNNNTQSFCEKAHKAQVSFLPWEPPFG